LGDLLGGHAVDECRQHVALSLGELLERRQGAPLAGLLAAQLVDHGFAVGAPDERGAVEHVVQRGDDIVEEGVLADPSGGPVLEAGGQDAAPGLGREHHHVGAGGSQRLDELDPAAHLVAEPDVEQHAAGLEALGVFDHRGGRRAGCDLDVPAPRPEGELETGGDEGVILDDQDARRHRGAAVGKCSWNDVPPRGRWWTVTEAPWSIISWRTMKRPRPVPLLC